jgi:hypothetical protein
MGLLIFAAVLAVPIALLGLMLRLRERKRPGGGYGGRYDAPGKMSLMTYAEANAMVDRHRERFVESSVSGFEEMDVTNRDTL